MGSRRLLILLVVASLVCSAQMTPARAEDLIHSLGPGKGVLTWDGGFRTCEGATLLYNADGTYEDAYCVRHSFLAPPDGGAFAECFSGDGQVCAFVLDLTRVEDSDYQTQTLEVVVWSDAGGEPGSVVCLAQGLHPSDIGTWPTVTRHEFEIPEGCCVAGQWWAGMRSGWGDSATPCYWWYPADQGDPGGDGCPMVRVPPGIDYPEGWQPVTDIFGGDWTRAMGIGVRVNECPPTPAKDGSWGRVKALYR